MQCLIVIGYLDIVSNGSLDGAVQDRIKVLFTRFAREMTAHAAWLRSQHRKIPKSIAQALDMMRVRCNRIYGEKGTMTTVVYAKLGEVVQLTALEVHEAEMMDAEDTD
jgi:hypothetical protein